MKEILHWVDPLPERWKARRMKHVVDVAFSNVDKKSGEGEVPVSLCNYTDVYNNEIIAADMNFMRATATSKEIERFGLVEGDVIVTKDSETWDDIAVPALVAEDVPALVCGYHLALLRGRPNKMLGAYLLRAVQSSGVREQFHVAATGVTRFGLGQSALRDALIPVPPLPAQRAIANFLDRATSAIDQLIRKKERLIELLQEKRQALITQAVTKGLDPNVPMKDSGVPWLGEIPTRWTAHKLRWILSESPRNGVSPQTSAEAETPTFSIAAVRSGLVRISENLKYADIPAQNAAPYLARRGDVLVMRGNGSLDLVGSAGIVDEEPPSGCIYPDILIRLRCGRAMNPRYLVAVLNSAPLRAQIETAARTAAGIWKISGTSLAAFRVPIPPRPEQERIVAFTSDVSARAQAALSFVVKQIESLREYRQALISAAVTGQIDVSNEAAA